MNKIVALFCVLIAIFCGVWVLKSKTPLNNDVEAVSVNWGTTDRIEEISEQTGVSVEWILDPEIPENYVPVLGEDELCMVVDDNGNVEKYRRRTKQEDGSWLWEDVNPDIPDYFVPVDGLEDVYSVTDENGSVKYYKYIRNDDGTYTFIEVDKDGNIIDSYIVENEEKAADENKIPENYEDVGDGIYAVKDKNNVTVGYKEVTQDKDGVISFKDYEHTEKNDGDSSYTPDYKPEGTTTTTTVTLPTYTLPTIETEKPEQSTSVVTTKPTVTSRPTENQTYTEQETYTETKISGGYKITYRYTIIKTYDKDGELISTKKEGPEEIGREVIGSGEAEAPNKALIEKDIDDEIIRMSNGMQFREEIETGIVTALNAERMSEGLSRLTKGGNAQKLAKLFCADMAKFNHSDYDSQLYGTISELIKRYNIDAESYAINVWRTTDGSAEAVHSRFQSLETSRKARMHKQFTEVGVAVIYNNGYYYIAEVLLG